MSTTHKTPHKKAADGQTVLHQSPTMARLLDALDEGTDIGHYGHFVVATVGRHFLPAAEVVKLLAAQMGADKAASLVEQVAAKEYNPPKRERLLAFSQKQDYCLVPDANDPDSGNLYRELEFPEGVYEHITEYYAEKAAH